MSSPMQMKLFFIAIGFLAISKTGMAQGKHFVYVQSNNSAPFYLKLDGKIINSSSTGYIILPNMADGNYVLGIGFSDKGGGEQYFTLTVYQKNDGYILTNDETGKLQMMNVQTKQMLSGSSTQLQTPKPEPKTDLFADMLANEVKDSSLLKNNTTKIETPKPDIPTTPTVTTGSVIPTQNEESEDSAVEQILSVNNKEGLERVYVDHYKGKEDTIRAFMPASVNNQNQKSQETTVKEPETKPLPPQEKPIEEKKEPVTTWKIPDTPNTPQISDGKEPEPVILPFVVTSSSVNSDCKAFASEKDFLKIRMKMAMETSVDAMIDAAKKIMRTMCFSTGQIKNLSYLFLTDEGKYRFFDMAYAFAADSNLYYALESQLTDSYYINRFRAMIQK